MGVYVVKTMGNQPSIVQLEPDRERIETGGRTYFPQTEEKETESREVFSSAGVQSKLKSAIVTENTTHRKNSPKMNINVRRVQSSHEEEKHQVEDLTLTGEIEGKRNNIGEAGGIPLTKGRSQHLGITAEKVRYREEIEKNEVHGNTPTAKLCKNKHMSHKKEIKSNGERIQEDEEEGEEKKPTTTEGVLEVIVSNPLGNQLNNENQSFIAQDNLKQNEEKYSFDLNSSYGVVLQGKLEGTCQNASHNRIYDISREYERATGRKIECETLVDPRAEQIVVTSAGKSFWIIPSTHSFSRHSGVCALLGDKNIKPIPHQLQVGDILRLGSVGLLVTEINNGKYTKNDTPSNESKENDRKSNIDDNKIKKETSNFRISIAKQSSHDGQEIEYIMDSTTEHVQPEITGRIRDHISAQWPTRLARNRSMEGSESMLQCYICMDGEESEEDPLIAPCNCKGGTAFLHLSCLKKLIEVDEESRFRLRSSSKRKVKCSRECPQCRVCKGYYATHKRHLTDGRIEAVQCEDTKPPYITMTVITKHDKVPELFNTFYRLSFNGGISEVSIGRAASCDVVIAYRTVSTKHALIKFDAKTGAYYFLDAKSSNGSLLYLRQAVELHRHKKFHLRLGRCMLSLVAGNIPAKNSKNSSTVSKIANAASTSVNVLGSAVSKAMSSMIPKGNNLANKRLIYFCDPNDGEMKKTIGTDFFGLLGYQQDPIQINKNNQNHPLTRLNMSAISQLTLHRTGSSSTIDHKSERIANFYNFGKMRRGHEESDMMNSLQNDFQDSTSAIHSSSVARQGLLSIQRNESNLTFKQSDENEVANLTDLDIHNLKLRDAILSLSLQNADGEFSGDSENVSSSHVSDSWVNEPTMFQPHRSCSYRQNYSDLNSKEIERTSSDTMKQIQIITNDHSVEDCKNNSIFPSVKLPTMNKNNKNTMDQYDRSNRSRIVQDTEFPHNQDNSTQNTYNPNLSTSFISSNHVNGDGPPDPIIFTRNQSRQTSETPLEMNDDDMMFTAPLETYDNEDEENEPDFRHNFLANARSRCASDINGYSIDPELLKDYGYSMDPGFKHEIDTTMLLRQGLSRGVFTPHGKDDDENIHSGQDNLSEVPELGDQEMDDSYLQMNFRPLKFSRTREYQR